MTAFGSLAFATPWLLTALLALPVIIWLLRVTPPHPQRIWFPATRLLADLLQREETPDRTPWWLILLRMLIVALIILGLAGPLLNPPAPVLNRGPVVLLVDNGWASGETWNERLEIGEDLIARTRKDTDLFLVLPTARQGEMAGVNAPPLRFVGADDALKTFRQISPQPFGVDREAAIERLKTALEATPEVTANTAQIVWLSDGLAGVSGRDEGEEGEAVATGSPLEALRELGRVSVAGLGLRGQSVAILPPVTTPTGFEITLVRPEAGGEAQADLRLVGANGRLLHTKEARFGAGDRALMVPVAIPLELRNDTQRIEVKGIASASAVFLLDERWKRRLVGIVDLEAGETAQPLLAGTYYIDKALSETAELARGALSDVLEAKPTVLVTADVGQIVGSDKDSLVSWIEEGGVFVRFAGPRTANQGDELLPVQLRQGGRVLGGALSWSEPQTLAPFDRRSPFHGLSIPEDVSVTRQVLAEPSIELADRTWARLDDGTPLVTAVQQGNGWIVLFHITANPEWSSLPLSGLFVEMLQKLVGLSRGTVSPEAQGLTSSGPLPALQTLEGRGRLVDPPPGVRPLPAEWSQTQLGPSHPPGFYGPSASAVALNLIGEDFAFRSLPPLPPGVAQLDLGDDRTVDLRPPLFIIAFLLLLADTIITLMMSGRLHLPLPRPLSGSAPRGAARELASLTMLGATAALVLALTAGPARAQNALSAEELSASERAALEATLETRLAYVLTGDGALDEQSRAGLYGLSRALRVRTSIEPGDPIGVNLETDDLSLYPFLYWPMARSGQGPSPEALAKIDGFMKTGGLILFDTGDEQSRLPGSTSNPSLATDEQRALREILNELDIPPLEPVPNGHVLTKSFYLLEEFPGRWDGGRVWVQARLSDAEGGEAVQGRSNDGVSPLIIGSNNWAAAWAIDTQGRPLVPVQPGGPRQRELATRFGINVVMYTLTGNYKADQVHVPALLERLGQ